MIISDNAQVKRFYHCPKCKQRHEVSFPKNFAQNRIKYPFSYVYIHKLQKPNTIEDTDKDILTTLYIDANLNIRGVESIPMDDNSNILNKQDSKKMIDALTKTILQMQQDYDKLYQKYQKLKANKEN